MLLKNYMNATVVLRGEEGASIAGIRLFVASRTGMSQAMKCGVREHSNVALHYVGKPVTWE